MACHSFYHPWDSFRVKETTILWPKPIHLVIWHPKSRSVQFWTGGGNSQSSAILKHYQCTTYQSWNWTPTLSLKAEEYQALKNRKEIFPHSCLLPLSPEYDKTLRVIRVGGRLRQSADLDSDTNPSTSLGFWTSCDTAPHQRLWWTSVTSRTWQSICWNTA